MNSSGHQPGDEGQQDPIYETAVKVARAAPHRLCVARLQRTLAIGYNRAAALMYRMVAEGLVERRASSLGGSVYTLKQDIGS